jgi:hypothetical protein
MDTLAPLGLLMGPCYHMNLQPMLVVIHLLLRNEVHRHRIELTKHQQ